MKPTLPFCLECNDTGWLPPTGIPETPCPHCDTGAAIAEGETKMASHTPGPWIASPKEDCGPAGDWGVFHVESLGPICWVGDPYPRGANSPYENMLLIAAAPDMLAVLQDFVRAAYEQDLRLGGIVGAAEEAIAKALGKS